MKKIIVTLSLFIVLGTGLAGCASIADGNSVITTLKTPGAENAKCILENQDIKYVVHTNQTVELEKSPHDLVVRCMAPGNRERTVLVKREINGWVIANVVNGFVPGTVYDYFSRGGFDYPDVISVDFTGEPVKQYDAPQYMADDLSNGNHKGRIEYNGPGTIVDERNKNYIPKALEKKESAYSGANTVYRPYKASPSSNSYRAQQPQASSRPRVSYDPTEEDK